MGTKSNSSNNSYVQLSRKLVDILLKENPAYLKLTLVLISRARFKTGEDLRRGQLYCGRSELAKSCQVSTKTVQRFMSFAQTHGIVKARFVTPRGSVVTLDTMCFGGGRGGHQETGGGTVGLGGGHQETPLKRPKGGHEQCNEGDMSSAMKGTPRTPNKNGKNGKNVCTPGAKIPQTEFFDTGGAQGSLPHGKKVTKRNKKSASKPKSDSRTAILARYFLEAYKTKLGIEYPEKGPKFYGQITTWLRNVSLEDAKNYVQFYFTWNNVKAKNTGYCLGTLMTSLPSMNLDMKQQGFKPVLVKNELESCPEGMSSYEWDLSKKYPGVPFVEAERLDMKRYTSYQPDHSWADREIAR